MHSVTYIQAVKYINYVKTHRDSLKCLKFVNIQGHVSLSKHTLMPQSVTTFFK